ncbi:wall-associated receptor kinase 2-like [Silene latifolia]|uniref:wall-associated receptor kinase 2-like n=1 Tax=Silene latifolia TaxID=37657 RepID=UPI003D781B81
MGANNNLTITNAAKRGCPRQCGNLTVPYPFGIGPSCSLNHYYSLVCDNSYDPPKAFIENLNSSLTRFRVFSISESQIRVNGMIAYNCPAANGTNNNIVSSKTVDFLSPPDSPLTLSSRENFFSLAGSCDYFGNLSTPANYGENLTCPLSCIGKVELKFRHEVCSANNGCCKRPIRNNVEKGFSLNVIYNKNVPVTSHTICAYVFVGMEDSLVLRYRSDYSDPAYVSRTRDNVEMVVDWVVGNQTCDIARRNPTSFLCQHNTTCINGDTGGYRCNCLEGYQGNPYLPPGCSDINECAEKGSSPCFEITLCNNTQGSFKCSCPKGYHGDGLKTGQGCIPNSMSVSFLLKLILGLSFGLLSLLVIATGTYIFIRKKRLAKVREKFFKENGGLILKEKLSANNRGSIYNSFTLFTIQELKRATKSFSKELIVGVGGYGTVYKGTLQDESIVAVKVSKVVDNTQIEQFINEMVILTQIHHRNVVKLLGCCLEAEIPVLVYEFVANGSLLSHIHGESNSLTWKDRLRIATETATALGYLHSATSTPIIHRDIKSANILLDENYNAKISDFGASRLIPMDKTQMSTLVQGTLGYMDPEYLLSSQLTDKSDVYSFGVVVAELLTGEKPLSTDRRMGERNLAKYFENCFKAGRILEIIDPRIKDKAPPEQLLWVAEIVQDCLCKKAADRPMMKDVAIELEEVQRQTVGFSNDRGIEENRNPTQRQAAAGVSNNSNPREDGTGEAWDSLSYNVGESSFTIEGR